MFAAHLAELLQQSFAHVPFLASHPADELFAAVNIERPRERSHGHYAVNVSPLAKASKTAPPVIAQAVAEYLNTLPALSAVAIQGFVNVTFDAAVFTDALHTVLTTPELGKNNALGDLSILLEYVSANPTGPLHIGHGRWAALGDSLVRIWRHCGATVTPEFYINDAGEQMRKITTAVFLRLREPLIEAGKLPDVPLAMEYPYPGDYVIDIARTWLGQATDIDVQGLLNVWLHIPTDEPLSDVNGYGLSEHHHAWLTEHIQPFVKTTMLAEQQTLLERMGVVFEAWFSEKALLHDRGLVDTMLDRLKADGAAYEAEGALWLKTEPFGDDKDRVLIKSDGQKTYLAADIAYHDQKFGREDDDGHPQYNRIINIWGADHHGYIARMRAALIGLGHLRDVADPRFEIVLGQLVNLIVDGERERMGKRRKMLTLADVVDDVGADAVRFWMVSKSADTALDFDVDLAKSASNENPVFYAQYAHARCASILRNAVNPPQTSETPATPALTEADLATLTTQPGADRLAVLFTPPEDGALEAIQELVLLLDRMEATVIHAAKARAPHVLARYALDVAGQFHSVYSVCRILGDDTAQTHARLAMVVAVKRTLAQTLSLLGVSAPESM